MASIREHRSLFEGKESVQRLSRSTKTLVSTVAAVLGMVFGYLKLKNVSLAPFSDDAGTSFILKSTMVLYFFAWISGTLSDISDQEMVFLKAPRQGRLPWHAICLAVFLTSIFALLCAIQSVQWFVVLISAFWVIQHVLWVYLVHLFELPAHIDSKESYANTRTWDRLLLLEITYEHIAGHWIWRRFLFGIIVLAFVNLMAFTQLGNVITKRLDFVDSDFTVSLSVLAFVCVSEAWIWKMRIRTKMAHYLYSRLVSKYRLTRKPNRG